MVVRFWRERSLAAKLLLSLCFLSLVPIGVMTFLSLRHLETIQQVSVQETRALLVSSELQRLRERLALEAQRLAAVFSRLRDEVHSLRTFSEALLGDPARFAYRSGSGYRLDERGVYGNGDDGNSVLFVPRYAPGLEPLIGATESLDLVMRPLAEREPRMVLAWVIVADGLTRAYPWRDFGHMPRDKDYTTWPFYYLAGPAHNPGGGEVFTEAYLDPLSGEWMISALSPVIGERGHRATAGIDITIEKLLQEIGELRFSEGSSSALLAGTSVIAASDRFPFDALGLDGDRPPHGQDLASSRLSAVRAMAERFPSVADGVESLSEGGRRVFVGHAAVDPPGWRVVLVVPEADVLGPAYASSSTLVSETQRIRSNFVHILAFALIGILGITGLVVAHQSRGLRSLVSGIQRLGQGDLAHRLPEGEGEFGQLAHALNSMAQGLQEKKLELQRVYAEVEQERKLSAVGRLAAGVAHEVNNPLATISTYAQLLRRRDDLPTEAGQNLEVVMGEIRRIQEKLRNLLDLSRVESPVKTRLDPGVLIHEVTALARHEASARGVALTLELAPASREVEVDRSGLKQVLWNLVGNAVDAQQGGGDVTVRTSFPSDGNGRPCFVLEVEDQGPGIPEKLMPKIFEPFFTTKQVGQGTGLGLAVVYRIVRSHGGQIEAENLSPRGCRFRVTLPVGGEA